MDITKAVEIAGTITLGDTESMSIEKSKAILTMYQWLSAKIEAGIIVKGEIA